MGIFGNLTGWHLLAIVFLVLLLFGAPKLPGLAKSVGQSLKIFKNEVKSERVDDDTAATTSPATAPQAPAQQAPVATPVYTPQPDAAQQPYAAPTPAPQQAHETHPQHVPAQQPHAAPVLSAPPVDPSAHAQNSDSPQKN